MINKIIDKLTSCGFEVKKSGAIYKQAATNKNKEKKGQLNSNKNNVYFYAQNVAPFKHGTNTFKEILGNDYTYVPYVQKRETKTHHVNDVRFTFEDYIKTTQAKNNFSRYLFNQAPNLSNLYDIRGVKTGYLKDAVLFPYINYNNDFITAKIVQYNSITGKRNKDYFANNFHSYKPIKNQLGFDIEKVIEKKFTCFFGEHLVPNNNKPVVIVEAEKTAIILSMLFEDIVFIATGGLGNLKNKDYSFLLNRDVYLYPDNGASEWHEIGKKRNWFVSEILEAPEVKEGNDVVDYLEHDLWLEIEAELNKIANRSIEASNEFNFSYKEKQTDKFCTTITKELGLTYYTEANDKEREKYGYFVGRHFKLSNKEFHCITANVNVNRYDFVEGKKVKPTEKVLIKRLEQTFRVLKKLNPEENICNHFEKILNHVLENGNYLFNKNFVLKDLMPMWDNDTNVVSQYIKIRDWVKLSNAITNEVDFQKYLWRDRKRYDTYLMLKDLEVLINQNTFIQLSDVGLNSKRANSFIANLIETYNEKVLGCSVINNFLSKVKISQYLQHVEVYTNHYENHKQPDNFATLYKRTYIVWQKNRFTFKMPNQQDVINNTKVHKSIVSEYYNFKPKRNALKNLQTIIEYYIANPINLEVDIVVDRLQAKNNISLLKMKQTLKEQNAPSGITCKDAFDYPLDLTDSILNISQEDAMQKDSVFLYSWILFNYPEVTEVEKIEIYKNPINYLLQVNRVIAA